MSDINLDQFSGSEVKNFIKRIIQLESENAKLKAELEVLSIRNGVNEGQLTETRSSLAKCREALEEIKMRGVVDGEIAREALEGSK